MSLPDNFLVCWPPVPALSIFHGNLPQKICGATSLMFIMGNVFLISGINELEIFPPKSEILFYLFLALIWCRNFQDWTIPLGGDTRTSSSAERKNNKNKNKNKNKEISRSGLCASVRISPERYEIFEFRFHYNVREESRYQSVQTMSL